MFSLFPFFGEVWGALFSDFSLTPSPRLSLCDPPTRPHTHTHTSPSTPNCRLSSGCATTSTRWHPSIRSRSLFWVSLSWKHTHTHTGTLTHSHARTHTRESLLGVTSPFHFFCGFKCAYRTALHLLRAGSFSSSPPVSLVSSPQSGASANLKGRD